MVYSTNDPDKILNTTPHYTDERFRHAQTVYGREEERLAYDYSDRLWQWDSEKAEQAAKTANASGAKLKTARWYQTYLSAYFDKAVEVRHILAGWNRVTGYSYAVFGYRDAVGLEKGEK